MVMDYIKLDCPKCKKIKTQILKVNGIVKCPSCLKERDINKLIEKQLITRGTDYQ